MVQQKLILDAILNNVSVEEEYDLIIEHIKRLQLKISDERKSFELAALRYVLSKHKYKSQIYLNGLSNSCLQYALSKDNIELLKSFNWKVYERYEEDYQTRSEFSSFMIVIKNHNLENNMGESFAYFSSWVLIT